MPSEQGQPTPTRSGRRGGRLLVGVVVGGLVLLLVLLTGILLFADRLAAPIGERILARVLPWPDSDVDIASIDFHGLHGLTAVGVRLAPDPDGDVLAFDTLAAEFRLGELIRAPRRVRRLRLVGLDIQAVRRDTTWGWFAPFGADEPVAPPPEPQPALRIDRIEIAGAKVLATAAGGDLILGVDPLDATGGSIVIGGDTGLDIENATLRIDLPGVTDGYLGVDARIGLSDGVWRIASVEVTDTAGGRLSASGSVGPAGPDGLALDLRVTGRQFHIAQLHPSLSEMLSRAQRVDIDATVGGVTRLPVIDATLALEDAGTLAAETRVELTGAAPVLDLRATADAVDVRRMTDGRFAIDPVTGTLTARLDLAYPDSLDGPVTVDVRSAAGGQPIRLAGEAEFTKGAADVRLDARIRDIDAHLRGRIRPVADVPTYDVTLTGRATLPLPAAVIDREPAWEGPWEATVHVAGEGFAPDSLRATLDGRLTPVEATPAAGPGTLRGRVAGGTLGFDTRLALGGGTIDATGSVRLSDAVRGWQVSRLDVRDVALGPWLGEDDPGRITATATARAVGQGVRAEIHVDPIVAGRLAGLSGTASVGLADGNTMVDGRITRGDAVIDLETLALHGAVVDRVTLSFAGVDPSDFAPSAPDGELTGSLVLSPAAAAPGAPADTTLPAWARDTRLEGRLDLAPSVLGGQPIEGGVALHLVAGELTYDADIQGEEQSLAFAGDARLAGSPLAVRVDAGRFRNVDLNAWSGGRVPAGRINGRLTADVTGFDPADARADLELSLDSTVIGPVEVEHGTGSLALADGRATLRAEGRGGGRALTLDVGAELGPTGAWAGRGTTMLVDSSFPAPDDTLRVALTFATPDSAGAGSWGGTLAGSGPVITTSLDTIAVAVDVQDEVLTLRQLAVDGPEITLSGSGFVPLDRTSADSADLRFAGSIHELGPLLALGGITGYRGRATLHGTVTGPASTLREDVSIGLANLRGRDIEFDSMEVQIAAVSDTAHWLAAATTRAGIAGRRPLLFSTGGLPVLVGLGGVGTSGAPVAAGAGAEITWNAGDPKAATITLAAGVLDGNAWTLQREARVHWGDGIGVDTLRLRSTVEGGVLVTGGIDPEGEQDLSIEINGLPMQMRRRDSEDAVARPLDLSVRLTGPAAAPDLSIRGTLQPQDETARPWTLEADWNDERLTLQAKIEQPVGGSITVDGSLPLRLSLRTGDRAVELTEDDIGVQLDIADFDLARLEPLLDPRAIRDLQGLVRGDVHVSGGTTSPQFSGDVAVTAFGVHLEQYGTELASDRLAVTLSGEQATLADVTLRSGRRGTVDVTGRVSFPELTLGNLDLAATFDRFQAADSRALEAVVSGELNLAGTLAAPEVRGRVQIDEATYQVSYQNAPSSLERIELTDADYRELERRFAWRRNDSPSATDRLWDATTLDLTVSALSNVWARRSFEPAMAIEVAGDLSVTKEADAELQIQGGVRVVEGRSFVEEFSRRFEIASGTVEFSGPVKTLALEAEAKYEPDDDVTITLDVKGDSTGFALELGSDPELEQTDIISYIAVGKPSTDVQQFGESREEMAALGADIALSRIAGGVEDLARQALGLDVIEIRQDGLKGLTLVAGRYFQRRLYLGFQQPVVFQGTEESSFGITDTEVDAEYRVNSWLLANLSGSRSLARFFLEARYAY